MSDVYSKGQVTVVDGKEYVVRKGDAQTNDYMAMPNVAALKPFGLLPSATTNAGNVRAIQAVTGCPIDLTSVNHGDGVTRAAVACPLGTTPKY